jgi:beta-lactamase class A
VKGLDRLPGHIVYRKSGTWSIWHSDAALVEHGGKKYIAVALMEDSHGGQILPELIVKLDRLICGEHQ